MQGSMLIMLSSSAFEKRACSCPAAQPFCCALTRCAACLLLQRCGQGLAAHSRLAVMYPAAGCLQAQPCGQV